MNMLELLEQHLTTNSTANWEGSPNPQNPRHIRRVCKCGVVLPWPEYRKGVIRERDAFDVHHRAHVAEVLEEAKRKAAAEGWETGRATGSSRAMRKMSDEPNLPLARAEDNPYLTNLNPTAKEASVPHHQIIHDPDPSTWSSTAPDGRTYPFGEDDDGSLLGLGHQPPAEFFERATEFCDVSDLGWTVDDVAHEWVVLVRHPPSLDVLIYTQWGDPPVTEHTPGAVAMTTLRAD